MFKRKHLVLWILGWIFCFPIPLTIVILHSERLNKVVKIFLICILWFFILLGIILDVSGLSKENESIENVIYVSEKMI